MEIIRARIQPDELLAAGYRRFEDPTKRMALGNSYICSYQKRFDSSVGKKYFIFFTSSLMSHGKQSWEAMTASAQFRRNGSVVNIDLLNDQESLAETEALFEELWDKMGFEHYEALNQ